MQLVLSTIKRLEVKKLENPAQEHGMQWMCGYMDFYDTWTGFHYWFLMHCANWITTKRLEFWSLN